MKIFNPVAAPIITLLIAITIVSYNGKQEVAPAEFSITSKKAIVITADRIMPWHAFSRELEEKYGKPTRSDNGRDIYTIEGERWISAPQWNEIGSGKELVLFQMDEDL